MSKWHITSVCIPQLARQSFITVSPLQPTELVAINAYLSQQLVCGMMNSEMTSKIYRDSQLQFGPDDLNQHQCGGILLFKWLTAYLHESRIEGAQQ